MAISPKNKTIKIQDKKKNLEFDKTKIEGKKNSTFLISICLLSFDQKYKVFDQQVKEY